MIINWFVKYRDCKYSGKQIFFLTTHFAWKVWKNLSTYFTFYLYIANIFKNLYGFFFFCFHNLSPAIDSIAFAWVFISIFTRFYLFARYTNIAIEIVSRDGESEMICTFSTGRLENVESSRSIFTLGCSSAVENSRNKDDIRFFYLTRRLNRLILKKKIRTLWYI